MSTNEEFAGKVALVTGSSSGIGEETARRLSALGATVVVNSSQSVEAGEAVAAALPGTAVYVETAQGDVVRTDHFLNYSRFLAA